MSDSMLYQQVHQHEYKTYGTEYSSNVLGALLIEKYSRYILTKLQRTKH